MFNSSDLILPFFISLVIIIIIFLIIRELVLWYYKINERISLQERNNELLQNILNELVKSKNGSISDEPEKIVQNFEISSTDIPACSFNKAKLKATEYIENGNTGWRLPSEKELLQIYENRDKYVFLKQEKYWSGTEVEENGAIIIDFTFGVRNAFTKTSSFRAFFVRGTQSVDEIDANS